MLSVFRGRVRCPGCRKTCRRVALTRPQTRWRCGLAGSYCARFLKYSCESSCLCTAWFEPECSVVFGFVSVEFGFVAQREADVVEAVEQAVFAERVDLEGGAEALIVDDGLGFEVDGDPVVRILL